jgi:hypothetical protein
MDEMVSVDDEVEYACRCPPESITGVELALEASTISS